MGRYHRQVGFPATVAVPQGALELRPTRHAVDELLTDRYGTVGDEVPEFLNLSADMVFEMTVRRGRVDSYVVRFEWDEERDMVLVLVPVGRSEALVKTMWFNRRDDQHRSLDVSRYDKP